MSDEFIGEIRLFAGTFAPRNFAFCNGQIIAIRSNTALFSILGNTYGGDGNVTFALPNLIGCLPMHVNPGDAPELTPRALGEAVGNSFPTLTAAQLPSHSHEVAGIDKASNQTLPDSSSFPGKSPGGRTNPGPPNYAADGAKVTPLHPNSILPAGGGQPVDIRPPYVGLNFIICTRGAFPQRP